MNVAGPPIASGARPSGRFTLTGVEGDEIPRTAFLRAGLAGKLFTWVHVLH